eukprot:5725324-Pleurochrysis_carterae.AAC.1
MASTSAPRARSSASRVDGAEPSPENTTSARHPADAPSTCSGSDPVESRASPAGGVAATEPTHSCRPRADGLASAPAHTGAATMPPWGRPAPASWASTSPARGGAWGTAGRRGVAPSRSSAAGGGGSGGGGGRCGWAVAAPLGAGGEPAGAGVPLVAGAGALGFREA